MRVSTPTREMASAASTRFAKSRSFGVELRVGCSPRPRAIQSWNVRAGTPTARAATAPKPPAWTRATIWSAISGVRETLPFGRPRGRFGAPGEALAVACFFFGLDRGLEPAGDGPACFDG